MKVSIITVCRNAEDFIEDAIKSVLSQDYPNIEYIVIDGASTDSTLEKINKYKDKISRIISEPDKGLYDALNKGLRLASGEIIGHLNSDDFYAHSGVVSEVVEKMNSSGADMVWGNVEFVDRKDINTAVRFWKSENYAPDKFKNGWMPPHVACFVRTSVYLKYGGFNLDFKIAADYELMLRFLERYKIRSFYIDDTLIKMRAGGVSNRSFKNIFKANIESYKAWKINGLHISPLRILLKPLSKIKQLK